MQTIKLIVIYILLIPDCALNALVCDGSFKTTMSGQAWRSREHRWWNWTHRAIDWAFSRWPLHQLNHCQEAAIAEATHGSIWASWRIQWRRLYPLPTPSAPNLAERRRNLAMIFWLGGAICALVWAVPLYYLYTLL